MKLIGFPLVVMVAVFALAYGVRQEPDESLKIEGDGTLPTIIQPGQLPPPCFWTGCSNPWPKCSGTYTEAAIQRCGFLNKKRRYCCRQGGGFTS